MRVLLVGIAMIIGAELPLGLTEPGEAAEMSKAFDKCMSDVDLGAFKNTQFESCYAEEQQRDDQALNLAFTALRGKLSGDRRHAMIVGEKTWLDYRNAWCVFEGASEQAPSKEVNRLSCLNALTKAQVERLKEALDDPAPAKP